MFGEDSLGFRLIHQSPSENAENTILYVYLFYIHSCQHLRNTMYKNHTAYRSTVFLKLHDSLSVLDIIFYNEMHVCATVAANVCQSDGRKHTLLKTVPLHRKNFVHSVQWTARLYCSYTLLLRFDKSMCKPFRMACCENMRGLNANKLLCMLVVTSSSHGNTSACRRRWNAFTNSHWIALQCQYLQFPSLNSLETALCSIISFALEFSLWVAREFQWRHIFRAKIKMKNK